MDDENRNARFEEAARLAAELQRRWVSQQWELMRISVSSNSLVIPKFDLSYTPTSDVLVLPKNR